MSQTLDPRATSTKASKGTSSVTRPAGARPTAVPSAKARKGSGRVAREESLASPFRMAVAEPSWSVTSAEAGACAARAVMPRRVRSRSRRRGAGIPDSPPGIARRLTGYGVVRAGNVKW